MIMLMLVARSSATLHDLTTCCRGVDGGDGGDWYFPDGGSLPGAGIRNENRQHPIAQRKLNQLIRLQRGPPYVTGTIPDGIYRCDIETVAVNGADNTARETVYVGVYGSGGIIHVCTGSTCIHVIVCTYLYILFSYLECSI